MNSSLVHVHGTKLIKTVKKKNPTFFLNRRGSFRNIFFILWDSLQWVMWQDTCSKRCEQTRCQRNISFFFSNFSCFCSIIFYSYAFVLFLLYFVENRTVPIRSVSNGYCILDQNGTVHWTEPCVPNRLKKNPEVDTRLNARYLQKLPWLMIPDIRFPEFLPKRRRICFKSTTLQIFKWKQKDHHIGNILKFLLTHI